MKHIELWHGGRNLESNYKEFGGTTKGRWEYGPGLYLTTHYERARDYAKGGGKTYLVTVEEGNTIEKTLIDITLVNEFVSRHVIKSKQKRILEDLYDNMNRLNTSPKIYANILLNLIINDEAMQNTKTHHLNRFLVENGVDYGIVERFGGRDETVLVVYNFNKIKKVNNIAAKDVELCIFEKPFSFYEIAKKPSI